MDSERTNLVGTQREPPFARVVKLVDAGDSKSPAARRAGSIPAPGTTHKSLILKVNLKPRLMHGKSWTLQF
jgi:hypothetical protein